MLAVSLLLFSISNFLRAAMFKALVNDDTLLRTHCCPWCFLGCVNRETFVADTKCFWTKSETLFVSRTQNLCRQQMFACGQTGKHLCRQQCVRNNVSSFARAFTFAMLNGASWRQYAVGHLYNTALFESRNIKVLQIVAIHSGLNWFEMYFKWHSFFKLNSSQVKFLYQFNSTSPHLRIRNQKFHSVHLPLLKRKKVNC